MTPTARHARAFTLIEMVVVMSILVIIAPLIFRCMAVVVRGKDTAVGHAERLLAEQVLLDQIGREVRSARRVLDTLPGWVPAARVPRPGPVAAPTGSQPVVPSTQPAASRVRGPASQPVGQRVLALEMSDGSQVVYRAVSTCDHFGRVRPDLRIERLCRARPGETVHVAAVALRVRRMRFRRGRSGTVHVEFWFSPLRRDTGRVPYATLVVRPRAVGEAGR